MSYFIATCKYQKMQENGAVKRVSDKYLCDALTCTEAEAIVTENIKPYISGDFFTTSVKAIKIEDVFGDEGAGKFYLAKVALITLNEVSGKEKKTVQKWLVGADNFSRGYSILTDEIKKCLSDVDIIGLSDTPICEYLRR